MRNRKSRENKKTVLKKKLQAEMCSLFDAVPVEFKKYFELFRSDKTLDFPRDAVSSNRRGINTSNESMNENRTRSDIVITTGSVPTPVFKSAAMQC
ncbi:hypothetical protein K432DRAFT_412193 [Lepidopterella palustris CBS 459.81]|uniref:Uncharacterized protein n=1 Tax=Lepidopterella palustris CBS 459.81 TaxID=1314670 RepID=A0A8E2DW75_9PEZI|nr:hypothetical protein K432DRAFT_412193 [Lepidopterella palustris CBS 459.81]